MPRKFRFFPKMGMKIFSFGWKERCEGGRKTRVWTRGGLLFFLAWQFGALALIWGAWTSKKWGFQFGFQGFSSVCAVYNLIVVLSLLFLGFAVSRLGRRCAELAEILGQIRKVPADRRNGFCPGGVVCVACGSKIPSWKGTPPEDLNGNKELVVGKVCSCRGGRRNYVGRKKKWVKEILAEDGEKEKDEYAGGGGGLGGFSEDEEDDVVNLRKEVAKERSLRAAALMELEKERKAASSAADEAMAKILLLQNEKALIEREARHYRQIAEQKHMYDQEVIESLQWVIAKLEAERGYIDKPSDPGQKMMTAIE